MFKGMENVQAGVGLSNYIHYDILTVVQCVQNLKRRIFFTMNINSQKFMKM